MVNIAKRYERGAVAHYLINYKQKYSGLQKREMSEFKSFHKD